VVTLTVSVLVPPNVLDRASQTIGSHPLAVTAAEKAALDSGQQAVDSGMGKSYLLPYPSSPQMAQDLQ
jgi:hypothetical protein